MLCSVMSFSAAGLASAGQVRYAGHVRLARTSCCGFNQVVLKVFPKRTSSSLPSGPDQRRSDGLPATPADTVGQMSAGGKSRGRGKPAAAAKPSRTVSHRWRDYQSAAGRRPIKEFLAGLEDEDLASVVAAMAEVRQKGLQAARHLEGDIYEVRADGKGVIYRVLFAPQGKHKQVFLSLEAFKKKTQRTPPQSIQLAKRRLLDWKRRGK